MYGATALHVAAKYTQFEICELLLAHGADPLALDDENRTPLHEVAQHVPSLLSEQDGGVQGRNPLETCRAITNSGGYEILIENTDFLKNRDGPTAMFQYLQENIVPACEEMPVSSRAEVAISQTWDTCRTRDNVPAVVREALRDGKDIVEAITWTNEHGETLLHVFASALARSSASKLYTRPYTREPIYDNSICDFNFEAGDGFGMWRDLVRGCISAGASIEAVDLAERTPLQALIDAFWPWHPFREPCLGLERLCGQLEYTLYCWLADLAAAGGGP